MRKFKAYRLNNLKIKQTSEEILTDAGRNIAKKYGFENEWAFSDWFRNKSHQSVSSYKSGYAIKKFFSYKSLKNFFSRYKGKAPLLLYLRIGYNNLFLICAQDKENYLGLKQLIHLNYNKIGLDYPGVHFKINGYNLSLYSILDHYDFKKKIYYIFNGDNPRLEIDFRELKINRPKELKLQYSKTQTLIESVKGCLEEILGE